jgi:hypothetical protein
VGARPKTSSGPPSSRRVRKAPRPVSTASRSSITRRTASELLREWRVLRSCWTLADSSKRLVRVNALLMAISQVCMSKLDYTHQVAVSQGSAELLRK